MKLSEHGLASFKYVYVLVFFALLAGLFRPLITDSGYEMLAAGVLILLLGLLGGLLLWKAAHSKDRLIYVSLGLALLAGSLYLIFEIS